MTIKETTIVVRGGGDLASGTIHCLWQCGFRVIVLDIARPTAVRRTVAFCEAVYDGEACVEGAVARLVTDKLQIETCLQNGDIPLLIDAHGEWIEKIKPDIVVDAIIAKKNIGTDKSMAGLVIGLGPGFEAGRDVHVVIETMRGHRLGRILTEGSAIKNTGVPGNIGGYTTERVLRAPGAGVMKNLASIGDVVRRGDIVAMVDDLPVPATIDGVLRGLLREGLSVPGGFKIGDIDPRVGEKENCTTISDKARTIAGGVLQAVIIYGGCIK